MSDEDLFIILTIAAVCGGHSYHATEVARIVFGKIKDELEKMKNVH